jgi:hypothetical protein
VDTFCVWIAHVAHLKMKGIQLLTADLASLNTERRGWRRDEKPPQPFGSTLETAK